ncbi:DNA polymerase [uncultured archaeal virus]|uniref:DNA polymerase n=1 Tax=uncultured archaeal virus TaxID=1960247 RepID=A0A8B0LSE3_9VIRU|nr:DNA polymerase [uncultured archaeal virus]
MKNDSEWLEGEKSLSYPKIVLFFDTETETKQIDVNKYELQFKLGSYILYDFEDNKEISRKVFYNKDEFINDLVNFANQYGIVYTIAHNIDFDFKVLSLLNLLNKQDFKIYKIPLFGNPFIITFKKCQKSDDKLKNSDDKLKNSDDKLKNSDNEKDTIIVIDSFNIFKDSLKNLGLSIGYEKTEVSFEKCSIEELAEYCMNDTTVLLNLFKNLMKFLKENNISFKSTISGIALSCYRNNFLGKIGIKAPNEIKDIERSSYKGGRVECFKIAKINDVYYIDINSLYPYVACFELPIKFLRNIKSDSIDYLKELMKKHYIIADLDFKLFKNCIGVKRLIDKSEKLIFPVGKIKNEIIHQSEIELVLKYGHIDKINNIYIYEKGTPLKNFMEHFYKMKSENKGSTYYLFYKYLMNSLYGKFGQRNRVMEIIKNVPFSDGFYRMPILKVDENLQLVVLNNIGYKYLKKYSYPPFSNVALAGSISAYGRCYLSQLIILAEEKNCFYCDTDSIMLNKTGFDILANKGYIDDNQLGKFKLEKIGSVDILNAKWYNFDNKLKIKGIKNLHRKGFIKDTKIINEDNNSVEYLQERIERMKTAIRYQTTDKQILEITSKKLNKKYKKGIVENENIKPVVLDEY